jgi:hypothetical protein
MFKKVASVVLLFLGGFLLFALTAVFAMSMSGNLSPIAYRNAAIIVLPLFALPGAILMVCGVALWDWKRWRITLGTVLTVTGGLCAVSSLNFGLLKLSPELWEAAGGSQFPISPIFIGTFLVVGVTLLGIGIFLVIKQNILDRV